MSDCLLIWCKISLAFPSSPGFPSPIGLCRLLCSDLHSWSYLKISDAKGIKMMITSVNFPLIPLSFSVSTYNREMKVLKDLLAPIPW